MPNLVSVSTGGIDIDVATNLLHAEIDTVWSRRDKFKGQLARYFDVEKKTSGLTHIISNVGSALPLPPINQDTDALPYFVPPKGYDKKFILDNRRSGVFVTRTMLEADRFDKVESMTTGQLISGFTKDEYLRSSIFNNAFTGTAGADLLSLCNDSHPQENSDQGTWDNRGTGALTGANLQSLRLLAMQMTNDQGNPDGVMSMDLLVPLTLEQKANELVKSKQTAEDALNSETQLITGLRVVADPYLELGSTVQYFLIGSRTGFDKGLHEVVLSAWSLADNRPANADIMIDKRIRSIKTFGFTTSKNVFGSVGS